MQELKGKTSASVAAAGRAAEQAFGKLHVAVNNAGEAAFDRGEA
jgi:NAD(P)-dependent dehydrogenase (short-subunit alcohol dehydrogenase family)